MKIRLLAVLATALAFVAPVQAQSSYSSGFRVTERPPVGPNNPSDPAPARWSDNQFLQADSARASVRDQVGFVDGEPVWDSGIGNYDPEFVQVFGKDLATGINANAHVSYPFAPFMSASGEMPASGGQISARAKWENGFEIDPGATFTFSGIAGLSIYGDAAPLMPVSSIIASDMLSFASLAYADAADRVGFGLGAWLDRAGGLFSLTNNAGLVSLSITNNTASLLTGTLRVASYVNVTSIASPAPEPETFAMLLLGLAVVGATARRRGAASRRG